MKLVLEIEVTHELRNWNDLSDTVRSLGEDVLQVLRFGPVTAPDRLDITGGGKKIGEMRIEP